MELKLRRILLDEGEKLEALLHDEHIAPGALLGADSAQVEPFLRDLRNITLLAEDESGAALGAVLFHWQEPTIYEVHTMAKLAARGMPYFRAVRDALRLMFLCSDALTLYTRVPSGNDAALGLVRFVKGRREFNSHDCDFYSLSFFDWLWSSSGDYLEERGEWFHERLQEQFAEQKREHVLHEDNSDHDKMVGAMSEMIFAGIALKALMLYNRWAKLAGYAPLFVVVVEPLVLNIGDALLQVDFAKRDFYLLEMKPEDLLVVTRKVA